jgi:hypothetical protein
MATKNLFAVAKEKAPEKKAASKEKNAVQVNHITDELERLAEINEKIDALTAEAKMLTEVVKTTGIEEFTNLYNGGKYPGSFNMQAGNASVMFIPMDRYIKIDSDRKEELINKYGEEIIEEKTTYTMDTALVEKYAEEISKLIMSSKKITDEDKERLIGANVEVSIKKGTISTITESFKSFPIEEVLEDIKPVYQLKNVKLS